MVIINVAYTTAINPPSASPHLNPKQIWAGLQHKVRHAEEFVKPIESCQVLKEEGNTVTRQVKFAPGYSNTGKQLATEVCTEYEGVKVNFLQEDGSMIQNIVSEGENGEMFLTYVFEWFRDDVKAGSEEEQKMKTQYAPMARTAVHGTLDTVRKMAQDGKL
ncbi:hypothetical protein BP5796_08776 [Coleophoma crateriformis]|uniref:DUF1857-domain-containing protein n=1 Tax=Coleophoma crateriformis TaxID=565419 RepID=A0A3D8R8K4_9HELO|nr:hypothetical protein BP5796_08776 [Coleophoma crateriformis]